MAPIAPRVDTATAAAFRDRRMTSNPSPGENAQFKPCGHSRIKIVSGHRLVSQLFNRADAELRPVMLGLPAAPPNASPKAYQVTGRARSP